MRSAPDVQLGALTCERIRCGTIWRHFQNRHDAPGRHEHHLVDPDGLQGVSRGVLRGLEDGSRNCFFSIEI